MNIEELQQDVEDLTRNCNRLFDENRELKQQLAEKDAELNRYAELFGMKDKDFYIVEKTEYDKIIQGAKEIVNQLRQQLKEKDKKIKELEETINDLLLTTIDHESFYLGITDAVVAALEEVKSIILEERKITNFKFDDFNKGKNTGLYWLNEKIDQLIEEAKGGAK